MERTICSADGWFLEYELDIVRRVICFQHDGNNITPYVVDNKGRITYASACGQVVAIWHLNDPEH